MANLMILKGIAGLTPEGPGRHFISVKRSDGR
jgi:hypothetical protein